jgi:hypothetical protein
MADALSRYAEEVRSRRFPAREHEYGMDDAELSRFKAALGRAPK